MRFSSISEVVFTMLVVGAVLGRTEPTYGTDAIASGNWNEAGTWSTGIPGASDNVLVQNNYTITVPTGYDAQANLLALSSGTLDITGGTVNANTDLRVGFDGTSTGAMTVNGGTVVSGRLLAGMLGSSSGTVNLVSGSITSTGPTYIGVDSANSTGYLNVSGGTFTSNGGLNVGTGGGTGHVVQSGGMVTTNDWLNIGQSGTGDYALNGGTLNAHWITSDANAGTLKFNGGTLRALGDSPYLIAYWNTGLKVLVQSGGAIIDTAGFNDTVGLPLTEDPLSTGGGLTKNGPGTLLLNAANTYTGPTNVNGGTLVIGNIAIPTTNSVIVNNGGTVTFAGNDSWGNWDATASPAFTVNAGGILSSSNNFNTLWNLTLNGGTLLANGGANGVAQAFQLAGNLTVGGSSASVIDLVGSGNNGLNAVNISGNGNSTLTVNVADVTNSPAADLTVNTVLQNGRGTTSNLTKTGAGTLLLNAANTYTGTTTINEGTITLNTGNGPATHPSGTIVVNNGGILTFAGFYELGAWGGGTATTPVVVNTGGIVDSSGSTAHNICAMNNLTLAGGNLNATGGWDASWGAFNLFGTLTVTANSSIQNTSGSNNLLAPGSVNGSQTLTISVSSGATLTENLPIIDSGPNNTYSITQTGAGTVVLTAANTYSGVTTVNGGTLQVTTGGAINSNADLTVGHGSTTTGAMTVNGGTVVSGRLLAGWEGSSSGTVNLVSGSITTGATYIGVDSATATGNLNVCGGTFTSNSELNVGLIGTGHMGVTDGAVNANNGLFVGRLSGIGVLTVSGGTVVVGSNALIVGWDNATGTVNLGSGGSITTAGITYIGVGGSTAQGNLNVTGGTYTANGEVRVGVGGANGFVTQSGGNISVSDNTFLGRDFNSLPATWNVTGGTSNFGGGNLEIGSYNGTGSMTVDGGVVNVATGNNPIYLGVFGTTGTLNLKSGTFSTARDIVNYSSGTGIVNFDGGTLQVASGYVSTGGGLVNGASSGNFQPVTAVVKTGGAIIDTNGQNATISAVLTHDSALGATPDGGLTKNGPGTLTLSNANTYTGGTYLNAGMLTANSTSALGLGTVALSGGTLGIGGGVTLSNSMTLTSGVVSANGNSYLTGNLGGPGGLTAVGPGVLNLSGTNNYNGPTLISGGTLRLSAPPTLPAGTKIWPIGDSITEGGGGTNAGYRGFLYNSLGGTFQFVGSWNNNPGSLPTVPVNQTYHDGHGGWTSQLIDYNIDGWLTSSSGSGASIITMMIGTNDLMVAGYDVPTSIGYVSSIIDKVYAHNNGIKFLLAQVTPRTDNATSYNGIVANDWNTEFNAALVGLVADKRALPSPVNISLVDMNTNFPSNGLNDGLHPNDTGYSWMAGQWAGAMLGSSTTAVTSAIPLNSPTTVSAGATFDLAGNAVSIGPLSGDGSIMLGNSGSLTVNSTTGNNTTFSGVISGSGSLVKTGPATLILSGTNIYTGGTTVSAGILAITSASALPDGHRLIVGAGGTLIFDPSFSGSPIVASSVSPLAASSAAMNSPVSPVPEPSTLALLMAGLVAGLGAWRKRKKKEIEN